MDRMIASFLRKNDGGNVSVDGNNPVDIMVVNRPENGQPWYAYSSQTGKMLDDGDSLYYFLCIK